MCDLSSPVSSGVWAPGAHHRYAARRFMVIVQSVFAAVAILTWVIFIAGHAAIGFFIIPITTTALSAWLGVEQLRSGGVSETPTGIVNRTTFGYRQWRWDDIDRFTHVGSRVYVVTRERKACLLLGIHEGWRNSWGVGESRTITDLLNRRLQQSRVAAAS